MLFILHVFSNYITLSPLDFSQCVRVIFVPVLYSLVCPPLYVSRMHLVTSLFFYFSVSFSYRLFQPPTHPTALILPPAAVVCTYAISASWVARFLCVTHVKMCHFDSGILLFSIGERHTSPHHVTSFLVK